MEEELRKLIVGLGLHDPRIELETAPNGKVGGFVISDSFDEMPQIDRQRMIWDRIKERLQDDKQLQVISVITLTPEEAGLAAPKP